MIAHITILYKYHSQYDQLTMDVTSARMEKRNLQKTLQEREEELLTIQSELVQSKAELERYMGSDIEIESILLLIVEIKIGHSAPSKRRKGNATASRMNLMIICVKLKW